MSVAAAETPFTILLLLLLLLPLFFDGGGILDARTTTTTAHSGEAEKQQQHENAMGKHENVVAEADAGIQADEQTDAELENAYQEGHQRPQSQSQSLSGMHISDGQKQLVTTVLRTLFTTLKANPQYAWVAILLEVHTIHFDYWCLEKQFLFLIF